MLQNYCTRYHSSATENYCTKIKLHYAALHEENKVLAYAELCRRVFLNSQFQWIVFIQI